VLAVGEGSMMLLAPTSPTRFRIEGSAPGNTVTFQLSQGRATAVVLETPGVPSLTLTREGT
jgi:hypothetical protein